MMIRPFTRYWALVGTSRSTSALLIMPIISAPISVPNAVPFPPEVLVPPMTAAEMASIKVVVPMDGVISDSWVTIIMEASPVQMPANIKIRILYRRMEIPAQRAASSLSPMAYV